MIERGTALAVFAGGESWAFTEIDPLAPPEGADTTAGRLTSPMPGRVVQLLVAAGDTVRQGQAMMVIEAMKMEHTIAAPRDGSVAAVHYATGDLVEEGAELIALAAARGLMPSNIPEDEAGPLHLLKMAVGVGSLDEMREIRAARHRERGGSWVYTRNHPRRAAAVLAGGSVYWVIRGQIQVRQRVIGFRSERDDNGRAYCLIEVDTVLMPTLWRAWRPFQGWRYLTIADAPPDAPHGYVGAEAALGADAMPLQMLAELRALGLL